MTWLKELPNLKVHILPARQDNYIFILERNGKCIVVDPTEGTDVCNFILAQRLELEAILITHKHPDHIGGIVKIVETFPSIRVFGPRQNADQIPFLTDKKNDGDVWTWQQLPIMVIATPGHTTEHISFYLPTEEIIFLGDVLFPFGCGRIFDGRMEDQFASLKKLTGLSDKTLVFCAHEYALNNIEFTMSEAMDLYQPYERVALQKIHQKIVGLREKGNITVPFILEQEKLLNPFLRAQDFETFRDLRLLRDTWSGRPQMQVH
jgi:hydroxyacylglutathione hydrolase